MGLARIVLILSAFAYGAVALGFLAAPAPLASLVGVTLDGPTADNDVRAVYGGTALGLTLFLAASVRRRDWYAPALAVVTLTLGSMALARLLSIVTAGPPLPIAYALHASEILGTVLALVALRRLGADRPTGHRSPRSA